MTALCTICRQIVQASEISRELPLNASPEEKTQCAFTILAAQMQKHILEHHQDAMLALVPIVATAGNVSVSWYFQSTDPRFDAEQARLTDAVPLLMQAMRSEILQARLGAG